MKVRGKLMVAGAVLIAAMGLAQGALAETGSNPPEQVYAGPVLGYDNVVLSDQGYSANRGGLSYGGLVGVDSPLGEHGRVGLEAKVTGSTTSYTYTEGADALKLAAGVDMSAAGKLGWMVTPRTQVFTTIGFAYSRFTLSESYNGIKQAQVAVNRFGARVGVGAEYALNKQVRARLEYDYTHYGELKINGYDTGLKMERHQVSAGLLYGF